MITTIARISRRKPRLTISVWVVSAVVLFAIAMSIEPAWITTVSLPKSESAKAIQVIDKEIPNAQLQGTVDQGYVVFNAKDGIVVHRDAITKYLESIRKNPLKSNVESVRSPVDLDNASQISKDGKTAYAIIQFSDRVKFDGKGKNVIKSSSELRSEMTVEFAGLVFDSLTPPNNEIYGIIEAILILFLVLGALVAAGLPIFSSLAGVAVGVSLVRLLSLVFGLPEVAFHIGAMLGIGVGIDYSLFIVTRYREAVKRGKDFEDAIEEAMSTSGVAVAAAGITVVISILGILIVNLDYLSGLALGASLCVFIMIIMAITLVPALLATSFGRNLDKIPLPGKFKGKNSEQGWVKWSRYVQGHALLGLCAGISILLIISLPVLSMKIGVTDVGNESPKKTTKRAYDLLASSFGPGFNGPLILVVDRSKSTDDKSLIKLMREIEDHETVSKITPDPELINTVDQAGNIIQNFVYSRNKVAPVDRNESLKKDFIVFVVFPKTAPQNQKTTDLVHDIRKKIVAEQHQENGIKAYVTGVTAGNIDFASTMKTRIPFFMAAVLFISFLFLLVTFRSVLVALKAIIMNLFSILAAYGVVIVVFQWGWLSGTLGVGTPGPIEPWAPMMLFAILFGLSMDYEVFLISKIKEEYDKSGNNSEAVAKGLASTAKVITAAAAIMACVFGSFAFSDSRPIKLMGLGLSIAVLLDATVVRMLLIPAAMELLGDRNWWIPKFIERTLPAKKIINSNTETLEIEPV